MVEKYGLKNQQDNASTLPFGIQIIVGVHVLGEAIGIGVITNQGIINGLFSIDGAEQARNIYEEMVAQVAGPFSSVCFVFQNEADQRASIAPHTLLNNVKIMELWKSLGFLENMSKAMGAYMAVVSNEEARSQLDRAREVMLPIRAAKDENGNIPETPKECLYSMSQCVFFYNRLQLVNITQVS